MAKPGGKVGGVRKGKRADREKEKTRAKPGKAPKAVKPKKVAKTATSAKPAESGAAAKAKAKAKGPKNALRLVERVAEEIVVAEYERAVNGVAAPEVATTAGKAKAVGSEPAEVNATAGGATAGGSETAAPGETVAGKARVAGAEVATTAGKAKAGGAGAVGERETARVPEPALGPGLGADGPSVAASAAEPSDRPEGAFSELLRLPAGPVDLATLDTAATPGASSRKKAEAKLPEFAARLDDLQERLFAAARGGSSRRRVLLVLQGMDTSGKGGTVRHVVGQLDPNGTRVTAFKAPTEEERAHDFLWRVRNAVPDPGEVGIFDRSHYEDVLIARVRKLALPMIIGRRYQLINKFEQGLVADGVVLVKCFLHISPDEQRKRLLARLDNPAKHWKYNPTDVDERALWPAYQEAYRLVLERCSTDEAPWYVIPADHKWYRNYAITRLLLEALERIDPAYPAGAFDVGVERKRLLAG